MTVADRRQELSEQIAALFFAMPEFDLDVALRMAADVTAYRRGITPRSVLDEFFSSTWSDEEWTAMIRPQLEAILGGQAGGE